MKRYSKKEQLAYLSEWRASGKSVSQFCRDKSIKATTFHSWKKKSLAAEQKLVEIPTRKILKVPSNLLLQKGSYSVQIATDFDEALLKRVLQVLDQLHD